MRIDPQFNQMPQRKLSFWEKYQIVELFAQYPALTLKVLLHRRVGMRRADPLHVLVMAAILLFMAFTSVNVPLGLFAVAVAVAGNWQHCNRWRELRGKEAAPWHTYSDGVSPLEDLILRKLAKQAKEGQAEEEASPVPARRAALSTGVPLPETVPTDAATDAATAATPPAAVTEATMAAPTDAAPTDAATATPPEAPPEAAPTEAATEVPAETATEAPTETATQAITKTPTEAPLEAPAETATEAPTEIATAAPTEATTEAPAEPATEAATATEAPAGVVTEAPPPPPAATETTPEVSPLKAYLSGTATRIKDRFRPEWLAGEARIYRRLEPLVAYAVGAVIFITGLLSSGIGSTIAGAANRPGLQTFGENLHNASIIYNLCPLGLWVMFAAFCLSVDENLKWRHQVRAYLDWYDGQIDGATARGWGGRKGRKAPASSRRQTYGLSTGIGDDIRAGVERQAEALKNPALPAMPAQSDDEVFIANTRKLLDRRRHSLKANAEKLLDRRHSFTLPSVSKQTWQIAGLSAFAVVFIVVVVAGIIGLKHTDTGGSKPAESAGPVAPAPAQPAATPTVTAAVSPAVPTALPTTAVPSSAPPVQNAVTPPSPSSSISSSPAPAAPNALPEDSASVRRQIQAMYDQIANGVAAGKVSDRLKFATPTYTEVEGPGQEPVTRDAIEAAGDQIQVPLPPGERRSEGATVTIDSFVVLPGKADVTVTFHATEDILNVSNEVVSSSKRELKMRHHWVKTPEGWQMEKGRVL